LRSLLERSKVYMIVITNMKNTVALLKKMSDWDLYCKYDMINTWWKDFMKTLSHFKKFWIKYRRLWDRKFPLWCIDYIPKNIDYSWNRIKKIEVLTLFQKFINLLKNV